MRVLTALSIEDAKVKIAKAWRPYVEMEWSPENERVEELIQLAEECAKSGVVRHTEVTVDEAEELLDSCTQESQPSFRARMLACRQAVQEPDERVEEHIRRAGEYAEYGLRLLTLSELRKAEELCDSCTVGSRPSFRARILACSFIASGQITPDELAEFKKLMAELSNDLLIPTGFAGRAVKLLV